MIAFARIKQRIQNMLDDESTDTETEIAEFVNTAYRQIAGDHVWQPLLREVSVPTTVLPADLDRSVLYIQDDVDFIYTQISLTDRYFSRRDFNWFLNGAVETPLESKSDGIIAANGTNFGSVLGTFTSAMVGEYIQIGENEGIYRISAFVDASNLTLDDGYRGDAETAAYYEVRPRGTQKIAFTDFEGDALTPGSSSKLWYPRRPLPLYNDRDQLMLPGNCEAVRIMAQRMFLFRDKYDNDALRQDPEFQRSINQMKPINPSVGRQPRPRGIHGIQTRFGSIRNRPYFNTNNRRVIGT